MNRKFIYLLSLIFIPACFAFAEETITITTYYPSPYGNYYNLTATNNVTMATAANSRVGIGTATPQYALDVGVGSTTWSNWKSWSPAIAAHALTGPAAQKLNARTSGYSVVAARNPGASFSIFIIPWDGFTSLENNCNSQINGGWHAQAAIKGNYFTQPFDNNDFTTYSTVITDQGTFDAYKNVGTQWWVACSASFGSFGQTAVSGVGTTNYLTKYTGANTIGNSAVTESSGNVGIGSLATNGPVYSSGTILTNTNPSSKDYKENIKNINLRPARLLGLKPKSFIWKFNAKPDIGYIAEEVQEIFPELYQDDGTTKGYDAAKLPVYIIELLKEQQQEIENLKQRISKLEN